MILMESGWPTHQNPFKIICGTSAGAINGTALACRADDFGEGVRELMSVWSNFRVEQVYRVDSLGVIRSGARWLSLFSFGWLLRKWRANPPHSLLDNTPLVTMLHRLLDFPRLDDALANGTLHALAVTASSYTGGQHLTFYQLMQEIEPWRRTQRGAIRDQIGVEHLLVSSAIPFNFPAIPIFYEGRREYFGDGSMRQVAPISPAIHLGSTNSGDWCRSYGRARWHLLNLRNIPAWCRSQAMPCRSIFLDGLASDIERTNRVNQTLSIISSVQLVKMSLRPIEVLVISPSERIDEIASRHVNSLLRPVSVMLGGIGTTEVRGAALASYLLFERSFTRELIALGERDTYAMREQVLAFFKPDRIAAFQP